jgi:CheY-like chemotaxis protein
MARKPPFHVLIADDEYPVAREIANTLEENGAVVLGPVPNLSLAYRALDLFMDVDLAVLDVQLGQELVFPLADHLARDGVPLVFYTAFEKRQVSDRYRGAIVVSKSDSVGRLVDAVSECRLEAARQTDLIGDFALGVVDLLPELRLRARALVDDRDVADRLVQETLEAALASIERRAWREPAPYHLRRLLYKIHRRWQRRPN